MGPKPLPKWAHVHALATPLLVRTNKHVSHKVNYTQEMPMLYVCCYMYVVNMSVNSISMQYKNLESHHVRVPNIVKMKYE